MRLLSNCSPLYFLQVFIVFIAFRTISTLAKTLHGKNSNVAGNIWGGSNEISDAECVNRGCVGPLDQRVCTTRGCVKAAARLLNYIDNSVDPCDDFHQYACGQWSAHHPIPDDKSGYDVFDELLDRIKNHLKRLLESDQHHTSSSWTATHQKAQNVYKACTNLAEIKKRGVQPGLDFLAKTNIWPAIQSKLFNASTYDLLRAIAWLNKMGNSALVSVGIDADSKNPTQHTIVIGQAALGMPSPDYLLRNANDTTVQAYYQYMLSVAAILDAEKPAAMMAAGSVGENLSASRERIESQLPAVLDFEIALAYITTPKELTRDPVRTYNKMTIAELQQRVPEFDWLRFVNLWMNESGIQVKSDENVIVYEPEYLSKLFDLLKRTPLLTVANYLGWRTMQDYIFDLDDSLQEVRIKYLTILAGVSRDPPRYASCVAHAATGIPLGIARLYVANLFDTKSKHIAADLISSVRAAFGELITEADWLGQTERKLSQEKLASILDLIGYDDRLLNNTWLNVEEDLNVGNETDHFGNTITNNLAEVISGQRQLRNPIDRSHFDAQPADVNAFYQATTNNIKFLAGILQPPFFDRTQPMSLNFGGIGYVMGHEISHGFDDEGRQFDKNGLLNNWWKNSTVQNVLQRAQCVVDFYSNITVDEIGLSLNGQFTLGENLADLGGLNAAYRAHQNWLKAGGGGREPALPGLQQFSNEQLFFFGAASGWCSSERPEALKQSILTDPHSPERYRVNAPMANMPEFGEAFKCPLGSRMNPVRKCRVW